MKQLFLRSTEDFSLTPHGQRAPRDARPVFLVQTPQDLAQAGIYEVDIGPDGQERRRTFTQRWVFEHLILGETVRRTDGSRLGRSSYGFDAALAAAQSP